MSSFASQQQAITFDCSAIFLFGLPQYPLQKFSASSIANHFLLKVNHE